MLIICRACTNLKYLVIDYHCCHLKINLAIKVYKKAIDANKALAELKGLAELTPNQSIVLNSLILRVGKDSSEIKYCDNTGRIV